MTFFRKLFFHFSGEKISDDLFLVIDQVFRIFPLLSLIFVHDPSYMTLSSQEKHFFYSFHTFAHIRQHYFSKYWGGRMHGPSPTSNFGGTVPPAPPRFPPLDIGQIVTKSSASILRPRLLRYFDEVP